MSNIDSNLDDICKDRPLITKELFYCNAFYGDDYVIKEYCGLKPEYKLKAVIPHGIYLQDNMWDAEIKNYSSMILSTNEELSRKYKNDGAKKEIVEIGAAFLYANKVFSCSLSPGNQKEGSIFFLSHSTHHFEIVLDIKNIIDGLDVIDDVFKPITVCIYWKDYLLGYHIPFLERGYRVVSAGHIFDRLFYQRFIMILEKAKFALSNQRGSHLFYAVKKGLPFSLLPGKADYSDKSQGRVKGSYKIDAKVADHICSLFGSRLNQHITNEQLEYVDDVLGAKYFKSPEELVNILKRSEIKYYVNLPGYFMKRPGRMLCLGKKLIKMILSKVFRWKIGAN